MEKFVEKINQYLIENDHKEALNTVRDAGSDEILNETSWELVPIIVKFLTQRNLEDNGDLFESCMDILHIIADKCNPAETVLLLLEQAENSDDDVRFRYLLQPLSLCLNKSDASRYIEWVVSTIRAYTEALPLPENKMLQLSMEESIDDADPVVDRLNKTYESISKFLKLLVDNEIVRNDRKKTKVKLYLMQLHLILFGKPFSHLNIDTETADESNAFISSIMQMAQIKGDLLGFSNIINDRCNKRMMKCNKNDMNIDDVNHLEIRLLRSEIPDLAYANYYFILLSSELLQHHIPHVYNPSYVMTSCFYLGNYLITQSEYILVSKGLRLINNTLLRIELGTIEHETLELSVYTNLLSSLSQVMIYCDSISERKIALNTFRNYIERFNMRARYLVIIYLYETSNHSGFLALVINILKECIVKSLDEKPSCKYFVGNNLETLLKRVYKLPHGSSSDLVEISDEVIAALNLLRFLIIRDKANVTGIWSLVDNIQRNYLKLLREGIDLARAHWKVKIKDLENQKKECGGIMKNEIMNDDIIVTVGGENLPRMPIEEKIKFCHQALNALDIIESISIRVNECIEINTTNNISQREIEER